MDWRSGWTIKPQASPSVIFLYKVPLPKVTGHSEQCLQLWGLSHLNYNYKQYANAGKVELPAKSTEDPSDTDCGSLSCSGKQRGKALVHPTTLRVIPVLCHQPPVTRGKKDFYMKNCAAVLNQRSTRPDISADNAHNSSTIIRTRV